MSNLSSDLCTTKWTINGNLKSIFKKQIKQPHYQAWFYLNKCKCVMQDKILIDRIKFPYFNGLNKNEITQFKKEYNILGKKGLMYFRYAECQKEYVYIFKNKEFFNKFMFLRNEINKNNKLLCKIIVKNNILNKLKFKNTLNKNKFIYNILIDIIKNINYNNCKIMAKFVYYQENFNNIKSNSYSDLYKILKQKGIEKKFDDNFKNIYNTCLKTIKNIKINLKDLDNYKVNFVKI